MAKKKITTNDVYAVFREFGKPVRTSEVASCLGVKFQTINPHVRKLLREKKLVKYGTQRGNTCVYGVPKNGKEVVMVGDSSDQRRTYKAQTLVQEVATLGLIIERMLKVAHAFPNAKDDKSLAGVLADVVHAVRVGRAHRDDSFIHETLKHMESALLGLKRSGEIPAYDDDVPC